MAPGGSQMTPDSRADVVIAGGGLAGLATAHESLERGLRVLILDRDAEDRLGGLAKRSFGGVMFVDTPHQRKLGIHDTPELAWSDWQRSPISATTTSGRTAGRGPTSSARPS